MLNVFSSFLLFTARNKTLLIVGFGLLIATAVMWAEPARAQEVTSTPSIITDTAPITVTAAREQVPMIWLPFIGGPNPLWWFDPIENPIGCSSGCILERRLEHPISECFTIDYNYCGLWFEDSNPSSQNGSWHLRYNYQDRRRHNYPSAEGTGDASPAASVLWQVRDGNGVDLAALITNLRLQNHTDAADQIEDWRSRQVYVRIFRLDPEWWSRWNMPVFSDEFLFLSGRVWGHEEEYQAEMWRPEEVHQTAASQPEGAE